MVIGTGAIILGPVKIGDGAKIGAGSVVIKSIPPGSTVVGVPGRVMKKHRELSLDLEHGKLPDPVANVIREILKRQEEIENHLRKLEISQRYFSYNKEVENKFMYGDGI